jgi:branched-chain amino acid transport system substrate-binding protein
MKRLVSALALLALTVSACVGSPEKDAIVVGAVYPLSGSQGSGGVDEHRGVLLAADLANAEGGVHGRPIEVNSLDVPTADAAPGAIDTLQEEGVRLVLGSYGSTISAAAASRAASHGMLFWETGAVGMLPREALPGERTFRVPPTGGVLGRAAIGFVADVLAPRLGRDSEDLRFAVSYVDDVYGRSVAEGATAEIAERSLNLVGSVGYSLARLNPSDIARRIAALEPDVLFVSAYLQDGIDIRRALVWARVPLVASIGTSSSYCMPEFGAALGAGAVGLFASDKPAADTLNQEGLPPAAASLLSRANNMYRDRWGGDMSPAALAGFSAAWALFVHVLPQATAPTASAVAESARAIALPTGTLPNGSGLEFGAPGTPSAGDNLEAASVIWEWQAPGISEVVWPPSLATGEILPIDISPWAD